MRHLQWILLLVLPKRQPHGMMTVRATTVLEPEAAVIPPESEAPVTAFDRSDELSGPCSRSQPNAVDISASPNRGTPKSRFQVVSMAFVPGNLSRFSD